MHAVLVIALCAAVTIVLRALPFLCFGGKHGMPHAVVRLGGTLPPAIMVALVDVLQPVSGERSRTSSIRVRGDFSHRRSMICHSPGERDTAVSDIGRSFPDQG